jgi:hypothetical protein
MLSKMKATKIGHVVGLLEVKAPWLDSGVVSLVLELISVRCEMNCRSITHLTSLGGSIRVPSAFNFLYGLRPSHGRLPYGKMANSMEGHETVHSVCGPLTHSIQGTYQQSTRQG